MRCRLVLAVSLALPLVCGKLASAEDAPKIGVVDVNKVLQDHAATKDLLAGFKDKVADYKLKLSEKEKEIEESKNRLMDQQLLLTDAERAKQEKHIEELENDRRDFLTQLNAELEPEKKLVQKTVDEEIEAVVKPAIQRIGEREGYTVILLVPNDGILYYAASVDVTQQVVLELGKQ